MAKTANAVLTKPTPLRTLPPPRQRRYHRGSLRPGVHGHEFHRTTVQSPDGATAAWHWRHSGVPVTEGFVRGGVHASYLHTHWNGILGAAIRFTATARAYREARSHD
jgi:CobB/CobQ-like glutamine amidotransferase domain